MGFCLAVSTAFDLIRAHFWRASALALLVLSALQWAQATRLQSELSQTQSALTTATVRCPNSARCSAASRPFSSFAGST